MSSATSTIELGGTCERTLRAQSGLRTAATRHRAIHRRPPPFFPRDRLKPPDDALLKGPGRGRPRSSEA
jgi:hypothetical protein